MLTNAIKIIIAATVVVAGATFLAINLGLQTQDLKPSTVTLAKIIQGIAHLK